jgi:DnaA family protein
MRRCLAATVSMSLGVVLLDDVHLYTAEQQHAAFNWFVNAQTPSRALGLAAGDLPPADLRCAKICAPGWAGAMCSSCRCVGRSRTPRRAAPAADERGVFLSDEVMDFMLHRFSRDLGSLMQLLEQLDAYACAPNAPSPSLLIKSMLENE